MSSTNEVSRREFIGAASTAAVGAMVVPRHVLGGPGYQAPSDTLNIAGVGVGGVGTSKIEAMDSENIVALCDVDWDHAKEIFEEYPDANRYKDYRVMLEEEPDIDAVMIATPDHTHAVIAQRAMEMGRHVYVEKPLTYSVEEARTLHRTANANPELVTQMGNQGRSGPVSEPEDDEEEIEGGRRVIELIQGGAIGDVHTVHIWTDRPVGFWAQGVEAPDTPEPLPDTLAWDVFLGPAPYRPYHSAFHPFAWRGWLDYGVGALGDMGAHLMDYPMLALDLGYPSTVEVSSTPFNGVSYPTAMMAHYSFPREDAPPLEMKWYDGGLLPPRPSELPDDEELNPTGGVIYEGDEGKLMNDTYGENPRLLPEELHEEYDDLPQSLPRVEETHEMNFVNACKGEAEATSPFEEAAPLTETMLLGIVALRADVPHIEWDGDEGRITNDEDANKYLHREYRRGWTL